MKTSCDNSRIVSTLCPIYCDINTLLSCYADQTGTGRGQSRGGKGEGGCSVGRDVHQNYLILNSNKVPKLLSYYIVKSLIHSLLILS